MKSLDKIFNPQCIALIGASETKGSVGRAIFENLVNSNYLGTIYPINPKKKKIQGEKTYSNIKDTPKPADLAIIATPANTIPEIVEECGIAGVKGLVIISAGFKKAGEEGDSMVQEILLSARKFDMRIIGPNCLGFIKPSLDINASFAHIPAHPGRVAFISQSGAMCTAILDWSLTHGVGFSHFVSIGSMIDVGFHDLIDYFGEDANTNSILIYMESLTNARKFLSAARAFSSCRQAEQTQSACPWMLSFSPCICLKDSTAATKSAVLRFRAASCFSCSSTMPPHS